MIRKLLVFIALLLPGVCAFATDATSWPPHATYRYAVKDGQALLMDDYLPAEGSETQLDGRAKPAIVFVFGGGFVTGTRNDEYYKRWFKALNDNGYRVFSIDYRIALAGKEVSGGLDAFKQFYDAVLISSDDLLSASAWLVEHADSLGIDPGNLVVSGSSAGAMTVLQADWILANRGTQRAVKDGFTEGVSLPALETLPEGFRFAGVMSFAGSVLSRQGMPAYATPPAPTLLLHGTADKIVNYKKIHVFKWAFAGSDALAAIFRREGHPCNILRYEAHAHEIAAAFMPTLPEQLRFLETVVVRGRARSIDALVDDPDIPLPKGARNRKQLYGN